ncbi:hypothetical protein ASPZODRAFT_19670 [Penicilliopsis zonata CBS 506.65]|uniref:Transcription factor Iwr1 domain-containing protein n=1 Tax=Penicilliopsis zonata CBS 506.65 TaxID=1073090 RepID=A0A1L9S7Z2_9EURO|nr:hypothetical protein ASPZODRAFT_19670 [Penicilliopsis zonata CBS 506.65]OJJ43267.1 hypothetical protein ASPZODRAFT_19670 [Penicilliopsis zonata CBS 506.65]
MSLPPEQINIKRRREEEPVDTLYIQSELHQTKRRFTDFIFQRVRVQAQDKNGSPSGLAAAPRALRSPRSTSSLGVNGPSPGGVPTVRATSPGAEFREEQRLAAVKRETQEKYHRALHSSPATPRGGGVATPLMTMSGSHGSPSSSPGAGSWNMRKFQISRSSTPGLRVGNAGGVQKRKAGGGDTTPGSPAPVAILVEKLRKKPKALMAVDLALQTHAVSTEEDFHEEKKEEEEEPVRVRKRPVVNQAEKKWRAERQAAISAAKQHISEVLDKEAHAHQQHSWDEQSERLARELEQVALELDGMDDDQAQIHMPTTPMPTSSQRLSGPKPVLKYQPKSPNKPRSSEAIQAELATDTNPDDEEDSDGDYVYDTYIRQQLPSGVQVTDPMAMHLDQPPSWFQQVGIDPSRSDIGVIVITQEDEAYWEHFAEEDEDDEDRWDSEDADSNAENNPANDYPEEELSSDDENDDPTAVYGRYRHRGASDEEEYDVEGYDSEGEIGGRYSWKREGQSDSEMDW